MSRKKLFFSKRYLVILLLLCALIPIVVFPDKYIVSAKNGLNLFVLQVFPALFPFFFFSTILSLLNFGYDLGLVMKRPLRKFYNAPPVSGYALVMSMLCGYPVGAKILSEFFEGGLITVDEAKATASFTSTSGPLFIVGTVGIGMLGDKRAGFVILIGHYLATFINGLLFRQKKNTDGKRTLTPPVIDPDALLKTGMISSLTSVAVVGGFIIIFNIVLDILFDVGIVSLLARPLALCGIPEKMSQGIIAAFVEVTNGCLMVSQADASFKFVVPVCALLITNGGLSVTLQSLTFLSKCKISPAYYLLFKATQGILAFLISFCLSVLLF